MNVPRQNSFLSEAKYLPALVMVITVTVLGGTIWLGKQYLRERLSDQIARRDAQVISLWLNQASGALAEDSLNGITEDPADQLTTILESSRLQEFKGLKAVRLYDHKGQFVVAFPPAVTDATISTKDIASLKSLQPISRFRPSVPAEELWMLPDKLLDDSQSKPMALLEVTVPLYLQDSQELVGIAQMVLEGDSMAAEYAALDKSLMTQSLVAFLVTGSTVLVVLGFAFRQLQSANSLLSERTNRLLEANQELTLAAKTSAVGALTSHLIHGLKNPLSGLQNFIATQGSTASETDEWELAVSTAKRMQALVNEVVRVLREDTNCSHYEITVEELRQIIASKIAPLANRASVKLVTECHAEGTLANRDANLISLILENLLQNAIQATPAGKQVSLAIIANSDKILCRVSDEGPGFPEAVRSQLFKPCPSSKEGGSGIGLAISKQLANYLGAGLELTQTGAQGTVFTLSFAPTTVEQTSPSVGNNHVLR